MSTTGMLNELVEFEGPVRCVPGSGAVTLMLGGRGRGGEPTTALFAGAHSSSGLTGLPGKLHDVRLFDGPGASAARQVRLQSRELQLDLVCRSLQVHRQVGGPFFAAVPPVQVRAATRLGWAVLLSVLRIPGAARLLTALRGRP